VGCQVARLSESLVAVWETANVRFFTCVRSQVGAQVEVQREAFLADVAFVWLFTRVHQLVPFELRVIEELLATPLMRAPVQPLPVRHEVLSVGHLVVEDLRAVFNLTNKLLPLIAFEGNFVEVRILI
jgi:hypothetical protein